MSAALTSPACRRRDLLASSLLALVLLISVAVPARGLAQDTPGTGTPATGTPGSAPGTTPGAPPTGTTQTPAPPTGTTSPTPTPPARFPTPGSTRQVEPPPPTIQSGPSLQLPVFGATPPGALFDLRPSITLSEEYTDNFNRSRTNKQGNFRTSVSPGVILFINGAFTTGSIGYSLSGTHDTQGGEFNIFHALSGLVTWQATPRLSFTVADTLSRSDDRGESDRLGVRQDRGEPSTSNILSLSSDYLIGQVATREYYRLSTFFEGGELRNVSHTMGLNAGVALYQLNSVTGGYEYLIAESETGETRGHRFSASFSRQLTSLTSAGVSGSYALRTRTSDTTGAETDFKTMTVTLFNSYTLPWFSLTGSIGYTRLEPDQGQARSSIFTASGLTYQFAQASVSLTVESGFSETFTGGEDLGVVESRGITASLTYPLTPLLGSTLTTFYRENESTGIEGSGTTVDRSSQSWGATLGFSFQLLRNLTMGLDLSHREFIPDDRARGFKENRGRVSFSAAF